MEMSRQVARKINEFFAKYPVKDYGKGEVLLLADEDPKFVFLLLEGNVREYDISPRGDEIVVNVFKPLSFFPMSWPIVRTPNRYFFEAAGKVTVRQAPPEDVLKFIKSNPDIMLDLLTRLYVGVEGLRRRMAHLMGGSAKSRLLFELITECRRFGQQSENGASIVKISEAELGARAGLSRETVSRELHELKKLNLISITRLGIVLNDLDALEKRLGSEL